MAPLKTILGSVNRNHKLYAISPFVLSAANQQRDSRESCNNFHLAGVLRSVHEGQYAMPMRQFYDDRVRNEGQS